MTKIRADKESLTSLSEYASNVLYCWDPPYEELGLPRPRKRQPAPPSERTDPSLLKPISISAVRDRAPFRNQGSDPSASVAALDEKPYFSDWKTIYRIHGLWEGLSREGQQYVLRRLEENLKKKA